MSTLTGEGHSTLIENPADLSGYFQAFAKPETQFSIGLEAEFFAIQKSTGAAIPYHDEGGIQSILQAMARRFHYDPIMDRHYWIGLRRESASISLEPGGQVELSAPPVSNIFEVEKQLRSFIFELLEMRKVFDDLAWIAVGIQPFSSLNEIPWVPKRRYGIMAEYFKTRGPLSHWMMKKTATNQINLDYSNERNALDNLRTALSITSIVSAVFANSSFSDGRPNGFMSERLEIWNQTDPSRSGLIVEFTRPDRTFADYLDYVLNMPLIFIVRDGEWVPVGRITFRQFIRDGFEGFHATLGDFELHLSTAFPEVRLKQFMEIRGMDGQKTAFIPAVAAFWKGILYDPEISRQACELVSFATEADRLNLHREVPRKGLRAMLRDRPIQPIARALFELAKAGLARQSPSAGSDEGSFLGRVEDEILRPGKSPAETLVEKWNREFRHERSRLIEYLSIE